MPRTDPPPTVHRVDPLGDERWPAFLARRDDASVFHTPGWLRSLQRTYDYDPVVYTTEPPDSPLQHALVLCRVESRLTGRRLVSVPFADHCQPLWRGERAAAAILTAVAADGSTGGFRHAELRPRYGEDSSPTSAGFAPSGRFAFHALDLARDLDDLYNALHKTAVRQMIGRAEREGLEIAAGRSAAPRDAFYGLLLQTRRKHHLPPQPRLWFKHLAEELGEAVTFHVASRAGRPVAAIVTTAFKDVCCHKYGCSDPRFSNLGGTQLLLWRAIQAAKEAGAREFDMGRSDLDNPGLLRFKQRWGAQRTELVYHRYPATAAAEKSEGAVGRLVGNIFARLPDGLLSLAGRLLYRHFG